MVVDFIPFPTSWPAIGIHLGSMDSEETPTTAAQAQLIRHLADKSTFALLGIAPAKASPHTEHVNHWIEQGQHGQMHYLANHLRKRLDPGQFLPGARNVIVVADRHASNPPARLPWKQVPHGRIARYAWGDDYHRMIKKRLHVLVDALRERWPDHEYRACVDTAPTLEREHAHRAGLGWIGKHTLLIHRDLGSWVLLGQIVTTLPIEHAAQQGEIESDHCGSCTRCIDACPTNCIDPEGYRLDAQRCISYLTIEHRGKIDPALHPLMGDWIAGCDVCQEVCPFNEGSPTRGGRDQSQVEGQVRDAYQPRPPAPAIELLEVMGWNADDRRRAFQGSALKRIKLDEFRRNAVIAAGNAVMEKEDQALRDRIEELAKSPDEPDLVRATAQQTLERLGGTEA